MLMIVQGMKVLESPSWLRALLENEEHAFPKQVLGHKELAGQEAATGQEK